MEAQYTITGTIVARELGTFGANEILYGFLTLRDDSGDQKRVKVDSYTEWDTLSVGDSVEIHAVELGTRHIIVARRIVLNPGPFFAEVNKSMAEASG